MISRQYGQKGMTLIELMVSLAITGMVVSGALGLIFHEFRGTAIAKTYVTAAHEIGNAARWISQDAMMTESSGLVDGAQPTDKITLTWIERYDFANIPHSSIYSLYGNELHRDYDGIITTVARNITGVEFSQIGNLLEVSISCTPQWWNPKTVERTYSIYLRAAEGGTVQ